MEHWTEYSRFFIALFVILDPFAAVPIFLILTKNYTDAERGRIVNIASVTVLAVLVAAAGNGQSLSKGRNAADGGLASRPKGGPQIGQYRVAVLGKGITIPCKLRLVLAYLWSSEFVVLYRTLH